jgi:hypothetical protein
MPRRAHILMSTFVRRALLENPEVAEISTYGLGLGGYCKSMVVMIDHLECCR